jgi:hypothetical protein
MIENHSNGAMIDMGTKTWDIWQAFSPLSIVCHCLSIALNIGDGVV